MRADAGLLGNRVEPFQEPFGVSRVLDEQLEKLFLEVGGLFSGDHRKAPRWPRTPVGDSDTRVIISSSGIGWSNATPRRT